MASKPKHFTLHTSIRIDPSKSDEFLKALKPAWEAVWKEPECIFFDVSHDPADPGTYRFVEGWTKDFEWFQKEQLTKSYYGPYVEATKPLWTELPDIKYFDRIEGWSAVADEFLEGAVRK